jgi:hypothetical protein
MALAPFDLCYIATFPRVHLVTAFRFDYFSNGFNFAKPVDSHLDLLNTMYLEKERIFHSIALKMVVHDHYRNKPVVAALRKGLKTLHGRYGFIQEMRVYITERKSTEDEWYRKGALDDGILMDLAPHALSVIFELLPTPFSWENKEGHHFNRIGVKLNDIVGCYRARDNNCILHQGVETFGVIHIRGSEDIVFTPKESGKELPLEPHKVDILIAVGKGTSIDREDNPGNLKGVKITFDGTTVIGNFDTNGISGVSAGDTKLDLMLDAIDVCQGGINLPFSRLGDLNLDLEAVRGDQGAALRPFQTFDDAMKVVNILDNCLKHPTATNLIHYETGTTSADVINRIVGDTRWRHPRPLTDLIIGRQVPANEKID